MKQKWFWVVFASCICISAYFFGLNHSASKLKIANERLTILEEQLNELTVNIEEDLNQTNEQEQQIITQKKEIGELKTQLKSFEAKQSTEKKLGKALKEKKVFLTFDDGPSPLTTKILKILAEKDVKATFFTIGSMMEQYPKIVKQTSDHGHMVLPHSYSHKYSIYTTFETFYKDFSKVRILYERILGFSPPPLLRFPGGSSNQSSYKYGGKEFMANLTTDLKNKGYTYIDWNVISGDASSIANSPDKMLKQLKKGSENNSFIVALFHDIATNNGTVEILPEIIDYYRENGYIFRTFRDVTEEEKAEMMKRGIINKPISGS